jgi:hypothetical protein
VFGNDFVLYQYQGNYTYEQVRNIVQHVSNSKFNAGQSGKIQANIYFPPTGRFESGLLDDTKLREKY